MREFNGVEATPSVRLAARGRNGLEALTREFDDPRLLAPTGISVSLPFTGFHIIIKIIKRLLRCRLLGDRLESWG